MSDLLRLEILETPIGPVSVVMSEEELVSVAFRRLATEQVTAQLSGGRPLRVISGRGLVASRQLREYFAGERQRFELKIAWHLAAPFQQKVLQRLAKVPFGEVTSYGDLAQAVGSPGASRAVGGAMRSNRWPIVIPCHRVLAARGALGGFTGGLTIKRALLELEGAL